jgi:hypothetical protein
MFELFVFRYLADRVLMDDVVIGAMMCAYGVPAYITYGPPLFGSVEMLSSEERLGTTTIR